MLRQLSTQLPEVIIRNKGSADRNKSSPWLVIKIERSKTVEVEMVQDSIYHCRQLHAMLQSVIHSRKVISLNLSKESKTKEYLTRQIMLQNLKRHYRQPHRINTMIVLTMLVLESVINSRIALSMLPVFKTATLTEAQKIHSIKY